MIDESSATVFEVELKEARPTFGHLHQVSDEELAQAVAEARDYVKADGMPSWGDF